MQKRNYSLDWLRVLAFSLLIPFHVGTLYASWFYPLKSPRLAPGVEWLLMLLSPWRLALIFLIAGVASRHLIAKLGPGAFARDRLLRLLPVILFGMLVVNAPQTWIVAKAAHLTGAGLGQFWLAYLHNDHSVFYGRGLVMPRWDHLWFLLYLLPYGLAFAGIWKLKGTRRWPDVPLWFLLTAPALWLIAATVLEDRVWPRTDSVFNDWGAHLHWVGMFVTGIVLAMRTDAWRWIEERRGLTSMLALLLGAGLWADHALWLAGDLPTSWSWLAYDTLSGLFAWSVILSVCGLATHYLNRPSPLLSYSNTAVLPIYVLHQPILFFAAFEIFPLRLPLALEAGVLMFVTFVAALLTYHFAIRPFRIPRFLFGLRQSRPAVVRHANVQLASDFSDLESPAKARGGP
jgi:glucans biosynthesis protein C